MNKSHAFCISLFLCLPALAGAQQAATPAAIAPTLSSTTRPAAAAARINLDVLVTDKAGKPVADLEPMDFTLLDNGQPRKILSFRRTDGALGSRTDPPVEVIIVLDAVNLPYQAVTLQRLGIEDFLRRNGGHLAQPTSIFLFSSDGLRVQPAPSKDGNALAAALHQSTGTVRAMATAAGDYGLAEQFTTSIRTLKGIAENEARKPGRKMLIWIGSGWPWLLGPQFTKSTEGRQQHFQSIVDLSRMLREARITLYSTYSIVGLNSIAYEAYLKPITDPRKADASYLGLQVLATQTGGRVLSSSNDVVGQLADCVADIGAYYTLSFASPAAASPSEYHDLKVQTSPAGSAVRTSSGYYNHP
jgi:VWFA-related protein